MKPFTPLWQASRADALAGHLMWSECGECLDWSSDYCRCAEQISQCYQESGGIAGWRRYAEADLASFDWMQLPPRQAEEVQAYAEQIVEHLVAGWGLLMTGSVGCGKTHLAVGMGVLALGLGHRVYATTLGELLLAIRASWSQEAQVREAQLMERACDVDLLILDDLGMEKPTEWARDRLAYIVNQRYAAERATIVTTNLGLDELEARWEHRMVSRLYGTSQAVGFDGVPDYRRIARQEKMAGSR